MTTTTFLILMLQGSLLILFGVMDSLDGRKVRAFFYLLFGVVFLLVALIEGPLKLWGTPWTS